MNNRTGPVLILGASGQVGTELARMASGRDLSPCCPSTAELDIVNEAAVASVIASRNWSAVFNCAAYTAVDRAESEPEQAHALNVLAPAYLARETARFQIPFIHLSTDYVFDGSKNAPYNENDTVNPLSTYGKTKQEGECAVRAYNPNHAIIRTAWVVSQNRTNFVKTMIKLGSERPELRVVNDQLGNPTSAEDIAETLLHVFSKLEGRSGTWHFVNSGDATWYDLAGHIFAEMRKHGLPTPTLTPITTAEYPTAAIRPANSRLATHLIAKDFGIEPRQWRDAIDSILSKLLI
jgi:dTDP-4-dehydrorhamnose reductase